MHSDTQWVQNIVFSLILIFCGSFNLAIVVKIALKNWNDLKPLHVHQINYFSNISGVCFIGLFTLYGDLFRIGVYCPFIFLTYLLSIDNALDILVLQLDRFVAIKKPLLYRTQVDSSHALAVVLIAKVLTVVTACLASVVDPVFLHCPGECAQCIYVSSINVYTVAYPSLFSFFITIFVSIYVSKEANKFNSVQPQRPQVSTIQTNNVIQVLGAASSSSSANLDEPSTSHGAVRRTESVEEEYLDHRPDEVLNIVSILEQMDQSKSGPPAAVTPKPSTSSPNTVQNPQQHVQRSVIFKTLKMNLLTMAVFCYLVPIQVLTIMYENCNDKLRECDSYKHKMIFVSVIQLVIGCIHPVAVIVILKLNS